MAEAYDTRGARRREQAAFAALSSASTPQRPLTLNDLPNDVLVSVFMATEDLRWVRWTVPRVCKAWNELFLSKDASPLHETLEVDFGKERRAAWKDWGRRGLLPIAGAASQRQAPRSPVIHGSRVISWAERRADSVRKLHLMTYSMPPESVKGFSVEDLCALVEVVAPSLTEFRMTSFPGSNRCHLLEKTFWESLQGSIVPAGRMRSFVVEGYLCDNITESFVAPLGRLAGSLEEVVLSPDLQNYLVGQLRFPVSFCDLTELRRLVLRGHKQMTAIPAEISSLKKLEVLDLSWCGLSSLPKEMGELSGLTKLDFHLNTNLGDAHHDGAFPAELGKMKSLRELNLRCCSLHIVPSFVGELKLLEHLDLSWCRLSSLPKELGKLSRLTKLVVRGNQNLGNTPQDVAFPAELGKMKSLRELDLGGCGLRAVPAFVGELKSLEDLDLFNNDLHIDASLDFLIESCPRLRKVSMRRWRTRPSLAHIKAFEAKLRAKNPDAFVLW